MLRAHARSLVTLGMGVVLVMAVRSARQVVVPLWTNHLGMTAVDASLVVGISGAVDMLVFYPAGKVMDLRGRVYVVVPMLLVMTAGFAALPFSTDLRSVLGVAMVIGFGNGIGSGIVLRAC